MKLKEPECHAQRLNNDIFDATGALTTIAQDVRAMASAMLTLGLSSGEDLYRMGEEVAKYARVVAHSHGEYVNRQSEGSLYHEMKPDGK